MIERIETLSKRRTGVYSTLETKLSQGKLHRMNDFFRLQLKRWTESVDCCRELFFSIRFSKDENIFVGDNFQPIYFGQNKSVVVPTDSSRSSSDLTGAHLLSHVHCDSQQSFRSYWFVNSVLVQRILHVFIIINYEQKIIDEIKHCNSFEAVHPLGAGTHSDYYRFNSTHVLYFILIFNTYLLIWFTFLTCVGLMEQFPIKSLVAERGYVPLGLCRWHQHVWGERQRQTQNRWCPRVEYTVRLSSIWAATG